MLSLPDMPLEVIEAICRPLRLRDRLALTSFCRTLLARPDVAGSAQLWGALLTVHLGSEDAPPPVGFFTRRAAGLRKVDVVIWRDTEEDPSDDLAALLGALGTSGLVALDISSTRGALRDPGAALRHLSRLTTLTRLRLSVGLEAMPENLSTLKGLADLELLRTGELDYSGGLDTFEDLTHLGALTRLGLLGWNLTAVPPQLTSLTRLQALLFYGNLRLGKGGEASFEVLPSLPTLRTLRLSACGLQAVPLPLAALPALEALDLSWNFALGEKDPAEAFSTLCKLAGLTSLCIPECGLRRVPPQLTSLIKLAHLELGANPLAIQQDNEEEGDAHPFSPLVCLTTLTRLDLRNCSGLALLSVPPQVAALTGLRELDLSMNEALGKAGEAGFQPLLRLSALTRLNLRSAGLTSLPLQLSELGGSLLQLNLSFNEGLGVSATEQAFQPLHHATALTALELCQCSLQRLPLELSALGALRSLELDRNKGLGLMGDYEQVFGPLHALHGLTQLGLGDTDLLCLPPQLPDLRALRVLNVSGNEALGQRQQDDPEMWCQLSGLAALETLVVRRCHVCSPPPPVLVELARRAVVVEGLPGHMG